MDVLHAHKMAMIGLGHWTPDITGLVTFYHLYVIYPFIACSGGAKGDQGGALAPQNNLAPPPLPRPFEILKILFFSVVYLLCFNV